MAILMTLKGPQVGRQFVLKPDTTTLGRHIDSDVCLESQAVSRQHARISCEGDAYFVEDLRSSNGTYINGKLVQKRTPLTDKDTMQVGPYLFGLRRMPQASQDDSLVVRQQISADLSNQTLQGRDAAQKLRVVLEIAQHLARTLQLDPLLDKLLDHLMQLFPQSDRAMVILCEGEHLVVRSQRSRGNADPTAQPYSRTIVQRALKDGVGILSEDVRSDERFRAGASISSLEIRALLCVPLIAQGGRRLGVIQLERFRLGQGFREEELHLLTVVGLQVAVVLENAALHAELLREERLRQELAMARDIQQSFLPSQFPDPAEAGYELFARLLPAREVAGDFYDFFPLDSGHLAFFVGDVSGKGMPAALFMMAVRTLARHLAAAGQSPAATLRKMNTSLAADNPSGMFVTLVHGIYHPSSGEVIIASGGHPKPLLRRRSGAVEVLDLAGGRLLGYETEDMKLSDTQLTLAPGETLAFYTDGITEAPDPERKDFFGGERLCTALSGERSGQSLEECADYVRATVEQFGGGKEMQDDMTLFLLRRV